MLTSKVKKEQTGLKARQRKQNRPKENKIKTRKTMSPVLSQDNEDY